MHRRDGTIALQGTRSDPKTAGILRAFFDEAYVTFQFDDQGLLHGRETQLPTRVVDAMDRSGLLFLMWPILPKAGTSVAPGLFWHAERVAALPGLRPGKPIKLTYTVERIENPSHPIAVIRLAGDHEVGPGEFVLLRADESQDVRARYKLAGVARVDMVDGAWLDTKLEVEATVRHGANSSTLAFSGGATIQY